MSKLSSIKLQLAKMLAKFGEVKTDKAILTYAEEELAVGIEVFVANEAGEFIPAEDGDYVLEDGRTVVVVEGKVSDIKEPEVIEAEDEVTTDGVTETDTEAIDAIHRELNELYEIVDALVKKVAELEEKGKETDKAVEELGKTSVAMSAEEEIKGTAFSGIPAIDKKLKNFIG